MENKTRTNTNSAPDRKLFGAYPQKQRGLHMQRIAVLAGNLTAEQLRLLVGITVEFAKSAPLHLTTRQDIEFHNIPDAHTIEVQDRLTSMGLTIFGSGGDSIRNITVCPCCRFNSEALDTEPLAEQVREALNRSGLPAKLPRKFKISFAGCREPQSRPYINDLSFIATSPDTLRVIGAGSLGARPEPGIILFERIGTDEVIPLSLAAAELFVGHGDRQNRRKARLRHIRQRMGDEAFLKILNEYFSQKKNSRSWPKLTLANGLPGWRKAVTIQTIAGELNTDHALILAKIAKKARAHIRINLHHGLELYAKEAIEIPPELTRYTDLPKIVACPGNSTCTNGLTNCPELAEKLSKILKGSGKYKNKTIALSGCPNNCTHSCIADVGLAGQIKTIDGKRQEVYKVMLAGGNGNNRQLAETRQIISDKAVIEWIKGDSRHDNL